MDSAAPSPPLVEKIAISSFRCLKSVCVDFSDLTILVGPNGAGKSSIMAALRSRGIGAPASVSATVRGASRSLRTTPLKSQYVRLNADEARKENHVQAEQTIQPDGSNLANVFATLPRVKQADAARQLCAIIPIVKDVDVRPTSAGRHELKFQDRFSGEWYGPQQVSDGTILVFAYIALTIAMPDIEILCVEEPEHGVHPYLVHRLITLLRDMAEGRLERKVQVVVATHSPVVLDAAQPHEVRFVSRDPNTGETSVRAAPTDDANWQAAYAEYSESLGDVWLSGSLGGVPGAAQ